MIVAAPERTAAAPRVQRVRRSLLDDLGLLTARLLPGSVPARALVRLNRLLDRWSHRRSR